MNQYYRFGLIGWPLEHSFSPTLHRAVLKALEVDGEYELYPIPFLSNWKKGLKEIIQRLDRCELDGLNVTIPYKQAVLPFIDHHTPTAHNVGAVNVLFHADGQIVGDNTDVSGFLKDLDSQFSLPGHGKALVLGAGGAARAVVYALASLGWQVHLTARRLEQAQHLVQEFRHLVPPPLVMRFPLADAARIMSAVDLDLVVNATPLGMYPFEHASPWTDVIPLPQDCLIYDLVYNPSETQFLRQARKQGLQYANGLGMLIQQAALAFLLWTNLPDLELPNIIQVMKAVGSF